MATLEQLIEARLEEKRQERLKAEYEQRQVEAEQQRREELATDLFAKWLESEYSLDVTNFYHQIETELYGDGDKFEARIRLNHPEEFPMVSYAYPLALNEVGDLEAIKNDDPPWDGWRDGDDWISCDNLIDAAIYALGLEN